MRSTNDAPAARPVDPNNNCRDFSRVLWSLIEEPDVCALCVHFDEDTQTCTHPVNA